MNRCDMQFCLWLWALLLMLSMYIYVYIYKVYMLCVCVCVCVFVFVLPSCMLLLETAAGKNSDCFLPKHPLETCN